MLERVLEAHNLLLRAQRFGRRCACRGSFDSRRFEVHCGGIRGCVHAGGAWWKGDDGLGEDDTQHLAGALLARIELHELDEVMADSLGKVKCVKFIVTELEGQDWERDHGQDGNIGKVVARKDGP